MLIKALFITRKSDSAAPELLEAWDEYSIDENPDGAREAFTEALARVGDDVDQFRYVELDVDGRALSEAFLPVRIPVGK